jgi:hypothetical protein
MPEAGAACQGFEGARTFSAEDQPERLAELIAGFVREPPGAAIPRRQNLLDTARQRRTLLRVGAHEDPRVAQAPDWLVIRDTVEAVLEPAKPLTLLEIAEAVAPQLLLQTRLEVPLIGVIAFVLRSNPHRFAEVAPGTWVRRSSRGGEGPEAGVPSKPPRPLLAGGAAAAAIPPQKLYSLDAVAGEGAHVAVEEELVRQRQLPGLPASRVPVVGGLPSAARKLVEPLAKAIKRVAPSSLNEA